MPTILKTPEGSGGVGLGGVEYMPDTKGCVSIPDGIDYTALLNHGLTVMPAPAPKPAPKGK